MNNWKIFKGNSEPHDDINRLPEPPSWRKFIGTDEAIVQEIEQRWKKFCQRLDENTRDKERGQSFRIHTNKSNDRNSVINMVNAALYLRRPLLVTGKPGTGKTSLAYAVAYELKLGAVLPWYITARSTLQEGLYRYDVLIYPTTYSICLKKGSLKYQNYLESLKRSVKWRFAPMMALMFPLLTDECAVITSP